MGHFSFDWFSHNIPNWVRWLAPLRGQPVSALEVGCYEGKATCWLLSQILTHPSSHITVIDTFNGGHEHAALGVPFVSVRSTFQRNTDNWKTRVLIHEGTSASILPRLYGPYQLAYIDGSHLAPDVLTDACLAWPLLASGATLIFDDYEWPGVDPDPAHRPKVAIDSFLATFAGLYTLVAKEYQVCLRKL